MFLPGSGQLVIVAGGGRDLPWSSELIATHLLIVCRGRQVQSLGPRGVDQAIASAAEQIGCPAAGQQHGRAAGPICNRRMIDRSIDLAAAFPLGARLLVNTTIRHQRWIEGFLGSPKAG